MPKRTSFAQVRAAGIVDRKGHVADLEDMFVGAGLRELYVETREGQMIRLRRHERLQFWMLVRRNVHDRNFQFWLKDIKDSFLELVKENKK